MALLDIGLVRTTVGNRVFGALKGATDGGLFVPHNNKRFPGYSNEDGKENYDAKSHRDRIFGNHVDVYMTKLKKEGEEAFNTQFSHWADTLKKVILYIYIYFFKKKTGVKSVEELYKKIHDEIRKSSDRVKKG